MAEGLRGKKAAVAGGEDRLSALPEELIHLVLSLLPSCQAVRTCLLAARWRTLWKSVPSLRVNADDEAYHSCQDLKRFIDSFLGCRDPTAPLHECEVLSTIIGTRRSSTRTFTCGSPTPCRAKRGYSDSKS
ncbi:hypothetical protein ZWY2020_036866 [Hordeum vulgare]|nr:hypothetical protein ZWY2020_036866 [Hordeum vulgare]